MKIQMDPQHSPSCRHISFVDLDTGQRYNFHMDSLDEIPTHIKELAQIRFAAEDAKINVPVGTTDIDHVKETISGLFPIEIAPGVEDVVSDPN